jgi:microcystin-dependent protein
MAKTKISEFSATSADNTDITNINIAEGCSPANVNNAIRSLMSLLKNQQDGSSGDPFTVAGTLVSSGTVDITGAFRLDGTAGASGQVLLSAGGSNTPTWGNAFVAGMIMMWSGTIATIPSGWLLCNGSSGTPDLRNRFVIGAFSDDSGTAKTTVTGSATQTGGSKDAIVVSHTHTATSTVSDPSHFHNVYANGSNTSFGRQGTGSGPADTAAVTTNATTGITVSTSISTEGSSGTNQNLPPYYALAFIMKS